MILGRSAPAGRVAIVHHDMRRAEDMAQELRASGHHVTITERGPPAVPSIINHSPDLLIGPLSLADPPLGSIVRGVRLGLGQELPILVVLGPDDGDSLVEADEIIHEPVDAGELNLRVGGLLRARKSHEVLERKVQDLLGLYRISWAFSLTGGPKALYGHLARESAGLLKARKGLVLLFDSERRQMIAQHPGFGMTPGQVNAVRYNVDDEARLRWNFRTNGPLMCNKPQGDTRLSPDVVSVLELHSLLVAPMTHANKVSGLIMVGDREGDGPFSEDDLNLLLAVAGQAAVAVENLRLHEAIKTQNDILEQYDRVKSEFVAIVAHDFRKPLMAIRGFAELVLEEPDIPAESRQEFMRTVITETEQLARLAEDTLLITRFETGEFKLNFSEMDLGPFILEAVPLGLSDHSVLLDVPRDVPKIVADPERLRQVVSNLADNAVKYSPDGGSVTVRCRRRGPDHVVIQVEDHGMGIPEDQVDRLFEKFSRVRTEQHQTISGTGLGLYICRLIVESHGGQIWVESELGKGSCFGVALPVDARKHRPAKRPSTRSFRALKATV